MQFIVVDRATLERGIIVKTPYIIISIRDPGTQKPRIRHGAGLRGVLALAFDDCEPAAGASPPDGARPMSPKDAAKVWRFVERHLGNIGAIVCQCEEGLSRAPAIATALAKALGEDAEEILAETDPNMFVYELTGLACTASNARASN